jgi:hypothetical protein
MTDDAVPLALNLQIEGTVPDAGDQLADLPEVDSVERVVTSDDRDLATVATTLVTLTTIAANAGTLTATLDNLIANVKKLAATMGWKGLSLRLGRHKVDLDDLSDEQKKQLLEQALAQVKPA